MPMIDTLTTIHLLGAGSVKSAFKDIITSFQAAGNVTVMHDFGAAIGVLERIQAGERCDVFASADMASPAELVRQGQAKRVFRYAGNRICAVLRPGLSATPDTVVALLADCGLVIGISDLANDPCGQYGMQVWRRVPGATAANLRVVTGGKDRKILRADGKSDYTGALIDGVADILLLYETLAAKVMGELWGTSVTALPPHLAVESHNGIAVLAPYKPAARAFVARVLSRPGQTILQGYGFGPRRPLPPVSAHALADDLSRVGG